MERSVQRSEFGPRPGVSFGMAARTVSKQAFIQTYELHVCIAVIHNHCLVSLNCCPIPIFTFSSALVRRCTFGGRPTAFAMLGGRQRRCWQGNRVSPSEQLFEIFEKLFESQLLSSPACLLAERQLFSGHSVHLCQLSDLLAHDLQADFFSSAAQEG